MILLLRCYLTLLILGILFYVIPDGIFKHSMAKFIEEHLDELDLSLPE